MFLIFCVTIYCFIFIHCVLETDIVDPSCYLCVFLIVVLLDTTSVLGELSWKTYPINGVSNISL